MQEISSIAKVDKELPKKDMDKRSSKNIKKESVFGRFLKKSSKLIPGPIAKFFSKINNKTKK